jgi:hypothetical protein
MPPLHRPQRCDLARHHRSPVRGQLGRQAISIVQSTLQHNRSRRGCTSVAFGQYEPRTDVRSGLYYINSALALILEQAVVGMECVEVDRPSPQADVLQKAIGHLGESMSISTELPPMQKSLQ